MRFLMCSVLDRIAEEYRGIYLERNENVAARRFSDAVRSGQMEGVKENARDFALVVVGEMDDQSGIVTALPIKVIVEVASVVRVDKAVGQVAAELPRLPEGFFKGAERFSEVNHGS